MPAICPDRRYVCSEIVTVRWSPHWGPTREATANLEAIWAEGAALCCEIAIAENTLVRIECDHGEMRGWIRSCEMSGTDFTLEVEFLPQSRWTRLKHIPDYLFDPSVLLGFPTLVAG